MPTELQAMALRAVAEVAVSHPDHMRSWAVKVLRERDGKTRALTEYVQAVNWAIAEHETARLTGYLKLLAAYRAETEGTPEALTHAQNIVERLIANDVFGRLRALRDELRARLDDERRDRQMACEHALGVLDELVGEE